MNDHETFFISLLSDLVDAHDITIFNLLKYENVLSV